jgi:endonuclease G
MKKLMCVILCSLVQVCSLSQEAPGTKYKPIVLDRSYEHTKWGISPSDLIYEFAAYTTSFDSDDGGVLWGVPEWVAYEIKKKDKRVEKYSRPKWMTDDKLNAKDKVPNDATYAVSGTRGIKEVSGSYRYVRGHMCPKAAADRISSAAGYNTHTILNAVPQLQWQNNGIWKSLESRVLEWADKYNRVWVICGPVFFGRNPAVWLGQEGEVKAAVADAFYKIVIRESVGSAGVETLSFVIPNVIPKTKRDFSEYLTSVGRIEGLTGLTFLNELNATDQKQVKLKHLGLSLPDKKSAVNRW